MATRLVLRSLTFWYCLSYIYAMVELPLDMVHRVVIEIFSQGENRFVGSAKPIATINRKAKYASVDT